jgi:hypothetical protein
MGMDLYKYRFLDGCPDGSGTKTKLYAPMSQIVRARISILLVLNVHIPMYLGSRGKPFFDLYVFSFFLICITLISKCISSVNCQFYFRSFLTVHSVSLALISPMWHSITQTLFTKFSYLEEKMYLGRCLFSLPSQPLAIPPCHNSSEIDPTHIKQFSLVLFTHEQ